MTSPRLCTVAVALLLAGLAQPSGSLLTAAAVAYFRTGRLPPTRKMIAVEAGKV